MADSPSEEDTRRAQQRRAKIVIKELRQHQQKVEDQKDEAVDCRSQVLTDHFRQAESNLHKATTADQALLDAQIFRRLGEFSKRQAAQLQMGLQSFDVKTFTDNLVLFMRSGTEQSGLEEEDGTPILNFAKLGDSVWNCSKKVPGMDFMLGNEPAESLAAVGKQKRTGRTRKAGIAVKPDDLKNGEVQQTETDREVAEMKRELQRRRQCNFWSFVIDPNSFARSIENIFHSSFLVKDGHASINLRVEPPLIKYIGKRDQSKKSAENDGSRDQSEFILGFSHSVFLEMVSKYDIQQCILPRKQANTADIYGQQRAKPEEGNGMAF
eukprot:GFKZ01015919.1.p1 GENE.GFKZ01015919.1~~GFKZ01015919.1.p1  ORF type:complete len:324 (+),score=55.00 GFKZ01015919.1:303-1274(+)